MSKRIIKKKINRKEVNPIDKLRDYVDRQIEKIRDDIMDNNVGFEKLYEACNKKIKVLQEKNDINPRDIIDEAVEEMQMLDKPYNEELKVDEADIDKKEKVFCKDCAHRIRKFDEADECLVSMSYQNIDCVTGEKSVSYKPCSFINENGDCDKFRQREDTFWERRKDGIYNRGMKGIFAPILIAVVIIGGIVAVAHHTVEMKKINSKNKTPVENVKPIGD